MMGYCISRLELAKMREEGTKFSFFEMGMGMSHQ